MNILNLSFNNNISLLTCGIDDGFIIYKLYPIQKHIQTSTGGGVGVVKILNKSNVLLLIGGGDKPFKPNNKLSIWDMKNKEYDLEIDMKEGIKNAFLLGDENKDNISSIIIVLKNKICKFNQSAVREYYKDTYDNEDGLCVFNNNIIVTLGLKIGEIAIWDINKDEYYTIQAHKKEISAIAINKMGTIIASSSKTGTNIHIYDVRTRVKINEFKRGISRSNIYSICFNNKSTRLACCGNTNTLHIFDLNNDIETTKNVGSKLKSMIPKIIRPKYLDSQWSFIKIKINNRGNKIICGFDKNDDLHVATYNGLYYKISGTNYDKIKSCSLYTEKC